MKEPIQPPLCINCKHFTTGDVKYEASERCAHPVHGINLVQGNPIQPSCARQRSVIYPGTCGKEGHFFEEGQAVSLTARALSALPQDLFRTLQRAASRLDLDVNGLTAAEVVDRYTALGAQITLDFAARVLREGTNSGTCDVDTKGHAPSKDSTEGGAT